MTLMEHLSRLHREIPSCREVVYGDLDSGTVLRAVGDSDLRQEDHDARLSEAVACLGPLPTRLFGHVFGVDASPETLSSATLAESGSTSVFLRPEGASGDVICVTVAPTTSVADVGAILQQTSLVDD